MKLVKRMARLPTPLSRKRARLRISNHEKMAKETKSEKGREKLF